MSLSLREVMDALIAAGINTSIVKGKSVMEFLNEGCMRPASTREEIAIAIGVAAYANATRLAMDSKQTVGEKREYFVTLQQLEQIFIKIRDQHSPEGR